MQKKKYVLIGTGGRARMFYDSLLRDYKETSELLALCDLNQTRMDYTNNYISKEFNLPKLPTYREYDFEKNGKRAKA